MAKLKIVTVQAFTEKEAIAKANVNAEIKFNATTAWKNDEKPETSSAYFDAFASEYLEKKVKSVPGIGCVVTIESGVADSRERPYKVENIVTKGTRKYKTFYEGITTDGKIVTTSESKSKAEDDAKAYVTANKVDVKVRLVKLVDKGEADALTVKYAPSINTTLGTYVIFANEKEA